MRSADSLTAEVSMSTSKPQEPPDLRPNWQDRDARGLQHIRQPRHTVTSNSRFERQSHRNERAAGSQPIASEDDLSQIAVNGELYGYRESAVASLPARAIRHGIAVGMLSVCGSLLPPIATAESACAPAQMAKTDVVGVMNDLFEALLTDNQERLQQVTSPDFFAYDGGMRFSGPALMDLIKKGHASGKKWVWSITDPEVHVACDLAWITYVNQGSVEDTSGRQALTWLESAILEYSNGRWHIRFVHSTRAPKPT